MVLRGLIRPVDPVREGLVLVVFLYNFPVCAILIGGRIRLVSNIIKAHDLETIMHRRDQKVVTPRWRRMPLYSPSTASDIGVGKRFKKLSGVE